MSKKESKLRVIVAAIFMIAGLVYLLTAILNAVK